MKNEGCTDGPSMASRPHDVVLDRGGYRGSTYHGVLAGE